MRENTILLLILDLPFILSLAVHLSHANGIMSGRRLILSNEVKLKKGERERSDKRSFKDEKERNPEKKKMDGKEEKRKGRVQN